MKIAISTENELVSAHFGRCPTFTIIEIENNELKNKKVLENPGHEPGRIPAFLNDLGVKCIVAGGMGMRATDFFNQYGIETIVGITGKIDDVISDFLKGNLKNGESLCAPGAGKGYGVDKSVCDHEDDEQKKCN